MAKVSDIKDSKYLSKEDCGPQGLKVTITGWTQKDVSKDSEPEDIKYILEFNNEAGAALKPLVLNNTNGQRIEAITGSDDFDNWIGHEIILYNDPDVEYMKKKVGGIRVFVQQKVPEVAQQAALQGFHPNKKSPQPLPQGVTRSAGPEHIGDGPPPPSDDDVSADLDQEPV